MRALALLVASTVALTGCTRTRACKAGTVLVSIDMPAGTDTLQYVVTIDGVATSPQSVALPSSGKTSGTLELDFSAYPAGRTVIVSVTALGAGSALASGTSDPRTLASGCDTLTVHVTGMVLLHQQHDDVPAAAALRGRLVLQRHGHLRQPLPIATA